MARIIPFSQRNLVSDPFNFLREEIDRLFDKSNITQGINPNIEVRENKEGLIVTAELPGLSHEDIDITLAEGLLTISGEKKTESTKEDQTYYITERQYGSFSRSLKLPYQPEQEDITATFKNGILTLTVPRPATALPNTRKIAIQKE